jgi:methyl-accepting chemotaxis protein
MQISKLLSRTVNKLFSPLYTLLSKMHITSQIMTIIFIMAACLVLEGVTALNAFNQMQGFSQKVFSESFQGLQSIAQLKDHINSLQKQYLQCLNRGQSTVANYNFPTSAPTILDSQQKAELTQLLSDIENVMKQPVNSESYEKFDAIVMNIMQIFQSAELTVNYNVINTMSQGNYFFVSSRNTSIIILIASLLLSLSIGIPTGAMIFKPLNEMVKVTGCLAKGDFTQTLQQRGSKEVNQLVSSLNHAIASLRTLVANVHEHAQVLALAGKELYNSSNDSGRAASEVARAIESLAKATSEEAGQIGQTAVNVNELGDLVEKVSRDSLKIAVSSKQVAVAAQNGQKISTDVASNIGVLYTTTKEIHQVIEELSQSSEKIKRISLLIEGIAEQTTLLALNAAIEAARAGEHGKGFSVVAKETGKLADQSKQASKEIGALVTEMLTRSSNAVATIQKGVAEVENGKTLTTAAATTFGNIFKQLEDTLTQINAVASSAQEMARHNEDVINAITSVAAISQEGLATTEEISATVEEQSAGAEQVAALAGNLSNIAAAMNTSVAAFKI